SSSVFFFFSSRRRHTRCLSDWSSDVCSSDLSWVQCSPRGPAGNVPHTGRVADFTLRNAPRVHDGRVVQSADDRTCPRRRARGREIGRASCRERGEGGEGGGGWKKSRSGRVVG